MSDASNSAKWIRFAEEDLIAISSILAGERVTWGVVCYLSQQAGEKTLKAFIASHGIAIRKIHDLGALLGECLPFDSSLADLRADCEQLTPFWVGSRYPGDVEFIAGEEEGCAMLAAAQRIRSRILPLIPK